MVLLTMTILSCAIFVGGPEYPTTSSPIASDTQNSLQTEVEQAISQSAQSGIINLHISEYQLTSYLASKIDEQSNPVISDPKVMLRDGEILVYGKVESGIFYANICITTRVSIDVNGQPEFEIVQTDLGPIPAPQGVTEAASLLVREILTGSIGPVATGFRLESISIANGVMEVSGRIK
jgi:hypothetical protein